MGKTAQQMKQQARGSGRARPAGNGGAWRRRARSSLLEGNHRVVPSRGGAGLAKNGTRLSASFSACQWMRATTPAVKKR